MVGQGFACRSVYMTFWIVDPYLVQNLLSLNLLGCPRKLVNGL